MSKNILCTVILLFSFAAHADVMNIYVEKEISDESIIISTPTGEHFLLEKLTMELSPKLFEGKTYSADVNAFSVKIYPQNKDEIEWSIKQSLNNSDFSSSFGSSKSSVIKTHEIQIALNDELFIINGNTFKSKVYCLGWKKGEKVKFIEGSEHGVCVSTTLLNINRGETCDLWCE